MKVDPQAPARYTTQHAKQFRYRQSDTAPLRKYRLAGRKCLAQIGFGDIRER